MSDGGLFMMHMPKSASIVVRPKVFDPSPASHQSNANI
jgi:hypothetical protein